MKKRFLPVINTSRNKMLAGLSGIEYISKTKRRGSIMNKIRLVLSMLLFLLAVSGISAYKNTDEARNALKSADDAEVIKACAYLGEEEEKKAVDDLLVVIKNHKNPKVRIAAISALSRTEVKGKPTTELKNLIVSEKDNTIVYAAVIGIFNLQDFENKAATEVLDFCDQNKKDDPYITDIVARIKKAMKK